jgi:hypothetical protein
MLEDICEGLIAACEDSNHDVADVIWITCQASIMLIDKYSVFTAECKIYLIAIGKHCVSTFPVI